MKLVKIIAQIGRNFRLALLMLLALLVSVASVHATGTDPIDFSTTGTTIGGYVTDAFAAAGAIFALIWGGKLMVKAFKSFGK